MFCLKISAMSARDFQQAMFIMSYYHVSMTAYSNGEDATSTYMVVGGEGNGQQINEVDLRNAESAFQINFRQEGMICPHCDGMDDPVETKLGELSASGILRDVRQWYGIVHYDDEPKVCGHLTFSTFIDSSIFDEVFG